MWLKQIKLFKLKEAGRWSPEQMEEKLEALMFRPCLPSLSFTAGWVPPVEQEDAQLTETVNGCTMVCLQLEEKILPATVIRQALSEKIKEIKKREGRNIRSKEKLSLKDEITHTLLPRAFSKLSKIYAYIDTHHDWLVVGTSNTKKTDLLMNMLKKTLEFDVEPIDTKSFSSVLTRWVKHQDCPSGFSIGKTCTLQDPNRKNRVIRCQEQNLLISSIQSLIDHEGHEIKQLALSWEDQISFILSADQFSLARLQYPESSVDEEPQEDVDETKQQQFKANFFIQTKILSELLKALHGLL